MATADMLEIVTALNCGEAAASDTSWPKRIIVLESWVAAVLLLKVLRQLGVFGERLRVKARGRGNEALMLLAEPGEDKALGGAGGSGGAAQSVPRAFLRAPKDGARSPSARTSSGPRL